MVNLVSVQYWLIVCDAGPTLNNSCMNVCCFLGKWTKVTTLTSTYSTRTGLTYSQCWDDVAPPSATLAQR